MVHGAGVLWSYGAQYSPRPGLVDRGAQAAEYIHGKLVQEQLLERAFAWRRDRVGGGGPLYRDRGRKDGKGRNGEGV